jgi:hypothetical protein
MTYQIRRSGVENRDDFIQERERVSAVGELQQLLIDTGRLIGFLAKVCRYAADTVGPGLSCGIALSRDGRPVTVARALNLYSPLNEVFGPDQQRRARTFAAEASEHRASRSDSLTRRSSARTSKLPWHRAPSSTKR